MQQPSTPRLASLPRRAYVIFGITALTLMMMAINGFIVSVAFPTIQAEFASNLSLVGWVFTGFFLSSTVVLPLAGKLSDGFGRKRVYLMSVGLFTAASIGCGLSPNVYALIAFRILQGVAGGAVQLSATGVVSDAFGERRQTALGLFSSIWPIGAVLGPNLGGIIIEHFSWRWIFAVNVPLGIVVLVLGMVLLPSTKAPPRQGGIDYIGAATLGGAIFLFLLALTGLSNNINAYATVPFWAYLVVALALVVIFVRQEGRAVDPMVDLRVLKSRPFLALNLYSLIYGIAIFAVIAFLPLNAQLTYDMSPAESGFVLTPRALVMIVVSTTAAFLLTRTGYRRPLILGALVGSLATFLLSLGIREPTLLGIHLSDLVLLSIFMGISGLGNGMVLPSMNNAGLDLAPGRVASVTALISLFSNTGNIIGTAVIILVMSQFDDQAQGLRAMFMVLAGLLLVAIPLTFLFPDLGRRRPGVSADLPEAAAEGATQAGQGSAAAPTTR